MNAQALALVFGVLAAQAASVGALVLHDRPLPHDAERMELMADYLRAHRTARPLPADDAALVRMQPRAIVLHWTGGPTAASCLRTFGPARLSGRPELARGGAVNVGAHFLVDRDGTIIRMQPEDRAARHAIGLNHVAIGVENVGDGARWPLTPAQRAANVRLIEHLRVRFPQITHLLGHHEVHRMRGDPLFEEADAGYANRKADPGAAFMAAVRAELSPGLQGPPPRTGG